jgi:CubicO group peptidase (beta-lactamase class C family)
LATVKRTFCFGVWGTSYFGDLQTSITGADSLAAVRCAPGQTSAFSPDRQARIESAISKFLAAGHAPGVSVAVVQDGKFVWSGGFGMADLENSVPATADTLYRLGSISKPITATAALVLSERGQLDLDAPVQKY